MLHQAPCNEMHAMLGLMLHLHLLLLLPNVVSCCCCCHC
jgi:hypothetical protein